MPINLMGSMLPTLTIAPSEKLPRILGAPQKVKWRAQRCLIGCSAASYSQETTDEEGV